MGASFFLERKLRIRHITTRGRSRQPSPDSDQIRRALFMALSSSIPVPFLSLSFSIGLFLSPAGCKAAEMERGK